MFKKRKMDERERMEMYKVEHYGFWVSFVALFISIFVQLIFMERTLEQIGGEWIVFLLMALVSLVGYFKNGHYDYYTEPGWKSYLFYASVFTVIFVIINAVLFYYRHWFESIGGFLLSLLVSGISMFGFLYIMLALYGEFVKKRRKKLEEKYLEDEAEEMKTENK